MEDGFLDDGEKFGLGVDLNLSSLLGAPSLQPLPFRLADVFEEFLVALMLVLDMGVGSGVGEVALTALTDEIPALRVLPLPPLVFRLWWTGAVHWFIIIIYFYGFIYISGQGV